MSTINRRIAAKIDGDFVVFLIGARINRWWKRAGEYEAIYNNMPPFGLGKVGKQLDAAGAQATAAGRLGKSDGGDAPVSPAGKELSR